MSKLTGHHCGITVKDLEKSSNFYKNKLGLNLINEFSVSGDSFSKGVNIEDANAKFAHFDCGKMILELVEYNPKGKTCNCNKLNQPGIQHIGLKTEDIMKFYKNLSNEVNRLSRPQKTETGAKILFIEDIENNLIEIIEP